MENKDNQRLPNVFPRPDEFDKIQKLGGFEKMLGITFGPSPSFCGKNFSDKGTSKMNGRIETYIHNDSLTQGKGGVIVKIGCETDFAAKTPEFIEFCKTTARLCYAIDSTRKPGEPIIDYVSLIGELSPIYSSDLAELKKNLKEEVVIVDVVKMTL